MSATTAIELPEADWAAEGERRFGKDHLGWRFVCPACGHVAAVRDWQEAGAPEGAIAFSCVGRYLPTAREAFDRSGPGPCNYAGGGLIGLNPVVVLIPYTANGKAKRAAVFAFADVGGA